MPRTKGSKNKAGKPAVQVQARVIEVKPPVITETDHSISVDIDDASLYFSADTPTITQELRPQAEQPNAIPEAVIVFDVSVLKPCPRCGKSDKIHQTYMERPEKEYFKYCDNCGFEGPASLIGYKDADKLWNEQ